MNATRTKWTFLAMAFALTAGLLLVGCQGDGITIRIPDVNVQTGGGSGTGSGGGTGGGTSGGQAQQFSFEGVWDTNNGELRLHEVGQFVIGDYAQKGMILGRRKGNCVAGVYTNEDQNGTFRFKQSAQGKFQGDWAAHGYSFGQVTAPGSGLGTGTGIGTGTNLLIVSGKWNGTLKNARPPARLQNFARGNATTRTTQNNRTVYDGTYRSTFNPGNVELYSRDLFLIGDVGNVGVLAGMWDGNSFVGLFTREEKVGWFDFEFFSANGQFRNGTWGWYGQGPSNKSWTLRQISSAKPTIDNMVDDVSCN